MSLEHPVFIKPIVMLFEGNLISHLDSQNNSPVDLEIFNALRAAMGDIFNELLLTFIEQSQNYLNELNDAYDEQNLQMLERIFHSMGSSSLSMGAQKLSELARSLEKKSTTEAELITQDEINALKDEYVLVEKVLNDLLAKEIRE